MAFFSVGGSFEYPDPEIISDRALGKVLNASYRATLESHRDEVLPGHFDEDAAEKYDYAPRNPKYTLVKLRKFHHARPLVFTSRMRQATKQSLITATRKRGQLIIRPGHAIKPQQAEEIEATTPREELGMADQFMDIFTAGIEKNKKKKKVRVK